MICDRIRALRESTGKSARKFAEEIGIKYTTYYGYETGSREPGSDTLVTLAKYYNVTTDYILGIENSPTSAETDAGDKRLDRILDVYGQLNEAGKNDLAKYADHLTYVPEYKNGKMIHIKVQKSVARIKPGENYEDIPAVDEIKGTIVNSEEDL